MLIIYMIIHIILVSRFTSSDAFSMQDDVKVNNHCDPCYEKLLAKAVFKHEKGDLTHLCHLYLAANRSEKNFPYLMHYVESKINDTAQQCNFRNLRQKIKREDDEILGRVAYELVNRRQRAEILTYQTEETCKKKTRSPSSVSYEASVTIVYILIVAIVIVLII